MFQIVKLVTLDFQSKSHLGLASMMYNFGDWALASVISWM